MTLPILYEDDAVLAINKPAGLLVHPLPNQAGESVVQWLLAEHKIDPGLAWPDRERAGIIHRLDRDTSGVLLIAKTPSVLAALQDAFANRLPKKTYLALCAGVPDWQERTLQAPVSRDQGTRRKASYLKLPDTAAKDAETAFELREHFFTKEGSVSLVAAFPKTGRTNQIRVHLELLELPILGDPWYQTKASRRLSNQLGIERLMLHAYRLELTDPTSGTDRIFEAPLAADFAAALERLGSQ